jgi:hypothetical protein
MRIKIELRKDQHKFVLHCTELVSYGIHLFGDRKIHQSDWDKLTEIQRNIVAALFNIKGVAGVSLHQYEIGVRVGMAFELDDIIKQVKSLMQPPETKQITKGDVDEHRNK